jgi:hypothetical protein
MTTIDPTALLAVCDAADRWSTYAKVKPDTLRALVAAREALARVEAGHEPVPCTDNPWDAVQERCSADDQPWPCATRRAITGEA